MEEALKKLESVIKLCEEALGHHFYGVCVPPYHVQTAKKELNKTTIKIKYSSSN